VTVGAVCGVPVCIIGSIVSIQQYYIKSAVYRYSIMNVVHLY
jgi:hypothetical protein